MTDEQKELMRIAAVSALRNSRNGKDLAPDAREWAFEWAARAPLGRPLSDGAPVEPAEAHS